MELSPIVYILLFSLQLILGTRIYLLNPGNRTYRLNALAMFVAGITIFAEYEIAGTDSLEHVTYFSPIHTSANISLVYIFILISWIFAKPFSTSKHRKILVSIPLSIVSFGAFTLIYQLLSGNVIFDSDLTLVNDAWTYRLILEDTWSYLYVLWFAGGLGMVSVALFFSYQREDGLLYRYWKAFLFIAFSTITIYLFIDFIWNTRSVNDTQGDYTMSPYLGLLTLILSWTFTNFKLFELTPEAAINNILESMTNLVVITNKNFQVKYNNRVVEDEFNLSKGQMYDNSILQLFKDELRSDFEMLLEEIKYLKPNGRFTKEFSVEIDEEQRHYVMIITPIDNGKIRSGFTFVGINLTEVKDNQAKLESSNRQLERFAYIASHDLKSPLRNIVSFLGLIKRKLNKQNDHHLDEYLEFATSNAQNMYRLIEDILEFSRMRKERNEERHTIDLNKVILQIEENLNSYLGESNCTLEYTTLPVVNANRTQMMQLFQNLIENGFKYNRSEHKHVTVDVHEKGGKAIVKISDNGIGIEPEFFDNIFEIFKRLHNANEYPGSGVGLAICKHIIEQHQGEIAVDSTPGEGSSFTFSLPLVNTEKAAMAAVHSALN